MSDDEKLRLQHFLVFLFLGLPAMLFFGIHNVLNGYDKLGIFCFFTAAALLVSCLALLHTKNSSAIYRFGAICYLGLVVYSLVTGGNDGSKSLWIFTFPLITFFLLGKTEGLKWSVLFGVIVCLILFFPIDSISGYSYSSAFSTRLLTVYLFVSFIAFWFEHFRDNYHRQLLQKNLLFHEILENSRDIIYRRDLATGSYQYISSVYYNLLGLDPATKAGLSHEEFQRLIHPDDRHIYDTFVNSAINCSKQDEHPLNIEYRLLHHEGYYLWFRDHFQILFNSDQQPEFILGVNREITSERKAHRELQHMRDRLFTILNSIDAHVYVADMQSHQILFMNSKMKEDFGQILEGDICWRAFRGLEGPCPHCTNIKLLDKTGLPAGVIEWEDRNPLTGKWYNNYDRAIMWLDGNWVRIQIAVDVTRMKEMELERQRDEEALRKARHLEAIGMLAAGIAHDFNNLLQAILGNCELLSYNQTDAGKKQNYIERIKSSVFSAIDLANYLTTFATGGFPKIATIAVADLIEEIVHEAIQGTEIRAEIDIPLFLPKILADRNQLALALKNLLNNSAESMQADGRLGISATHARKEQLQEIAIAFLLNNGPTADHFIKIDIEDSGCGIPSQAIEKVFDPYFSTKQGGAVKGQGLGLSVSRSIVLRHGGFMTIQSQENKGTIVTVVLPAAEIDM